MRFTIKAKLGIAFGAVLILLCVVGYLGISSLSNANERMSEFARRPFAQTNRVADISMATLDAARLLARGAGQPSDAGKAADRKMFNETIDKAKKILAEFAEAVPADLRESKAGPLSAALNRYEVEANKVWVMTQLNTQNKANEMANGKGQEAAQETLKALTVFQRKATDPRLSKMLADVRDAFSTLEIKQLQIVIETDDAPLAILVKDYNAINASIIRSISAIGEVVSPGMSSDVDDLRKSFGNYNEVSRKIIELGAVNSDAKTMAMLGSGEVKVARERLLNVVDQIKSYEDKVAKEFLSETESSYQSTRLLLITMIVGAMLVGVAMAAWIALSISKGLGKAVSLANAVAVGDLGQSIEVKTNDEIRDVVIALNSMVTNLNATARVADRIASGDLTVDAKRLSDKDTLGIALERMLAKLRQVVSDALSAANNVSSGSQQLSASAEELSQGATEQASSTEEASSSMEEMASNVKQNADNASQTEKIARQSAVDAEASGAAVTRAVEAMETIAQKISIVQEIARQTDLLALNAAVEAARAGEHGRGFAVVASEVRKLAERSQTAAQEIGKLSSETVKSAQEAGSMLARLVPDIKRTAELVEEITAACREQDIGSTQINQAIQQLDQVTQQNASASEQVAATSEELTSQADRLQSTIAFFRIDASDGVPPVEQTDTQVAKLRAQANLMRRPAQAKPVAQPVRKVANGGFALDLGHSGDALDEDFVRG